MANYFDIFTISKYIPTLKILDAIIHPTLPLLCLKINNTSNIRFIIYVLSDNYKSAIPLSDNLFPSYPLPRGGTNANIGAFAEFHPTANPPKLFIIDKKIINLFEFNMDVTSTEPAKLQKEIQGGHQSTILKFVFHPNSPYFLSADKDICILRKFNEEGTSIKLQTLNFSELIGEQFILDNILLITDKTSKSVIAFSDASEKYYYYGLDELEPIKTKFFVGPKDCKFFFNSNVLPPLIGYLEGTTPSIWKCDDNYSTVSSRLTFEKYNTVTLIAFHPLIPICAFGHTDGYIHVFNFNDDYTNIENSITLYDHTQKITFLKFHPNLPILVSGSSDTSVKLWIGKSSGLSPIFKKSAKFIAPDKSLLSHIETCKLPCSLSFLKYPSSLTINEHNKGICFFGGLNRDRFFSCSHDNYVKLHNFDVSQSLQNNTINTLDVIYSEFTITCLIENVKLQIIITGSSNGEIKFWSIDLKNQIGKFIIHDEIIYAIATHTETSLLYVLTNKNIFVYTIIVNKLDGDKTLATISDKFLKIGHAGNVAHTIDINSINRQNIFAYAVGNQTNLIEINIDADQNITHKNITILKDVSDTNDVITFAFHPTEYIMAISSKKSIKIYRYSHQHTDFFLIDTLNGHTGSIRSLLFLPSLQILASGSMDGTIILWSVIIIRSVPNFITYLVSLREHTSSVNTLTFNPDKNFLISGSSDKQIKFWWLG